MVDPAWAFLPEDELQELVNFGQPGAVEKEIRRLMNMCTIMREQRDRAERAQDSLTAEVSRLARELGARPGDPQGDKKKGRAG